MSPEKSNLLIEAERLKEALDRAERWFVARHRDVSASVPLVDDAKNVGELLFTNYFEWGLFYSSNTALQALRLAPHHIRVLAAHALGELAAAVVSRTADEYTQTVSANTAARAFLREHGLEEEST